MKNHKLALLGCLTLLAGMVLSGLPVMADSNHVTLVSGTMPLIISDIQVSGITTSTATISWITNSPATSQVFYDTKLSDLDNSLVTSHSVTLTGLSPSTKYLYEVKSVAAPDTEFTAISGDNTFTTLSDAHEGHNKTCTILFAFPHPSDFGQRVTFVAAVIPEGFRGVPDGNVTFMDCIGGTTSILGNSTLDRFGLTSFSTSILSADTHIVTAIYGGDDDFASSTSKAWVQKVHFDTTTTLATTPKPSIFGQFVTFTATVKVQSPGTVNPNGGSVTFYDDQDRLGSVVLSTSGTAVLSFNALSVGSHSIRAVYYGDENYDCSTSDTVTQTVKKASTSMVFTSSGSSVFGQTVKFTVSLTPGTATGSVTFKEGSTTLGTVPLSGGSAFLNVSTLKVGPHIITASYSGDGNHNPSSNTLSQSVNKASTATALTFTKSGSLITFTATVSAIATGAGNPSGTINFYDGGTKLGTGTLSGGKATLSKSNLSGHSITAVYSGDANFAISTSNIVKP
jgi:hypothetical protein